MAFPHHVAERVLDKLSITRREDLQLLEYIAWERGALVQERHLDGSEARITITGRKAIITISTIIIDPRRKRFSIAHELGHLEMHRYKNNLALCTSQDLNDWGLKQGEVNLEQEANEFAAALLLPERFFAHLCRREEPSLDFIAELAETFNVSLTATTIRFLHFCGEPCAVVFSQDRNIRWFHGSKEFKDIDVFIDVRSRLDPSSLAISFFQKGTIQKNPKRVSASAWFTPGQYRQDATIREQSWAMPSYNAVLTLLWVDDDIEEDGLIWP